MSAELYEVLAFAMRYWFIIVFAVILIAVAMVSFSEYRQRRFVMREVGRYIGYLEIEEGPEELIGERIGIEAENSIGRSRRASICIEDRSLNKTHALLYKQDGRVYLSPMASGLAKINGRKASRTHVVKSGDIINLGDIEMRLFLKEDSHGN